MSDPESLRRENELLTDEVLHLRAQLARATRPTRTAPGDEPPEPTLPGARPVLQRPAKKDATPPGGEPGADAIGDLRWLLRRLEGLPVKHLLRRKAGYRRLVEKYLG